MTESDDKTRWALAYVLFGLSEVLAVIHAHKSPSQNGIGYLAYGLPLVVLLPIFSARTTLKVLRQNPAIQADSVLRLNISMRVWNLVVFSYCLFVFAIALRGV
jgi:disulfide bond formation protein DsbB